MLKEQKAEYRAMDKYVRLEAARPSLSSEHNEVRIMTDGKMRNYIKYATTLLMVRSTRFDSPDSSSRSLSLSQKKQKQTIDIPSHPPHMRADFASSTPTRQASAKRHDTPPASPLGVRLSHDHLAFTHRPRATPSRTSSNLAG